jgi:DNA primase
VKNRGIVEATIKDFRIGWAPDGWKNLCSYLKGKGWSEAILEKAGLIKLSNVSGHDARSYYDRFRGRIIFPIADSSGRIIAFTGRILKDDGKSAKYLNSPDSPIFDKSMILFGLDKAKTEIRRKGYSILVEGQMDLIMSHQIGIKNVVASSGTALSDEPSNEVHAVSNLGLIRRLSPNLIIAMDSDNAGRKAAMRAVASTALSLGMSVKIADIEGGKDPADLIITNPESWKNVLRQAKHVVEYELGNIMKEVADNHKLARAIKDRLFPFLARIDSEMDKAYFVKIVAEKAGLNEQAVWEDLRKFEKEKAPDIASKQISAQAKPSDKKTKSSSSNHIDLVERRMFGLLHLMESVGFPLSVEYREQLKKIAGNSYEERVKAVEPLMSDIIFEAESFYGKDKEHWDFHMKELLINFEEDLINEELISSMTRLKIAEREGNQALVSEMAQKCQVLSIRKAETVKRRKN